MPTSAKRTSSLRASRARGSRVGSEGEGGSFSGEKTGGGRSSYAVAYVHQDGGGETRSSRKGHLADLVTEGVKIGIDYRKSLLAYPHTRVQKTRKGLLGGIQDTQPESDDRRNNPATQLFPTRTAEVSSRRGSLTRRRTFAALLLLLQQRLSAFLLFLLLPLIIIRPTLLLISFSSVWCFPSGSLCRIFILRNSSASASTTFMWRSKASRLPTNIRESCTEKNNQSDTPLPYPQESKNGAETPTSPENSRRLYT